MGNFEGNILQKNKIFTKDTLQEPFMYLKKKYIKFKKNVHLTFFMPRCVLLLTL